MTEQEFLELVDKVYRLNDNCGIVFTSRDLSNAALYKDSIKDLKKIRDYLQMPSDTSRVYEGINPSYTRIGDYLFKYLYINTAFEFGELWYITILKWDSSLGEELSVYSKETLKVAVDTTNRNLKMMESRIR